MNVEFIDIILFVLFFQILSLTPFLLFNKKKKGLSNKILGIFLLTKALCISNFISFRLYPFTLKYFPHAFWFGSSFTVLWGPGIYFYTRSLINPQFKFKKTDLLHLIPFGVHFIYLFFAFHIYGAEDKRQLVNSVFSPLALQLITGAIHLIILGYLIASVDIIKKYRLNIRNSFSSIQTINLSWMVFVLCGFSAKWLADIWLYFAQVYHLSPEVPLYLSRLFLFLFINIIIYKGLKQPEIFSGVGEAMQAKKSFLSKELEEKYLAKLSSHMEEKKPFLKPDITIMDIAEQVEIPSRAISEVINGRLNQNFYDYINSFRIKESKKLLAQKNGNYKTVLEILYEVGYNSKSSFNSAFKKYTGMTPTQYKRVYGN